MKSPTDAADGTRRAPRLRARRPLFLLAAVVAAVLLGLVSLGLLAQDGRRFGVVALGATAACTAFLLLLVAGLGWHAGVRLTRQRFAESLREARQQAHQLVQLQPDWQWATDAEHHLVRWQAPQGAPASAWVGVAATQALWDRFELDGEAAVTLRERLQAQQSFADLPVHALDLAGKRWRLRGLACWDGQGNFGGYFGTAKALADASPAWDWIEALTGPAWLVSTTLPPTVLAHNRAAATSAALPVGATWNEALATPPQARLSQQLFTQAGLSYCLVSLLPAAAPSSPASSPSPGEAHEHASFSYTVSHDLRAPLRVVDGFARILKEDYGRLLDRIGNDHLDRVMGAAARMNSMIDALLSLSQLSTQPLARQPVNLSQLAGFVVEELRRHTPERSVDIHIQPHVQVLGDPTLLRMVLENLLGNAWKYSGKCATAQIRFEAQQDGEQWVFQVGDNGAGFDMRFADRLFGVFQRLHSASDFQGTGVGLASVRRIVRRHGGDIWAESEVGAGARFYFTLASNSTASISRSD